MAWMVGAAALLLYLITLCPTVYVGDSGELVTAAAVLGVAHPPGYPLYVLLGRLFALVPIGSVAFRVNLMSALFGAAAAALLFLFVRAFLREREEGGAGPGIDLVAVSLAAFFVFSRSVWSESVKAEVYTLNLFWIILLLLLAARGASAALLFFLLGVAAANHQTVLLLVPGLVYALLARGERRPATLAAAFLAFAAGATLYLFLLARPDAPGLFAWRKPEDLSSFLAHVFRAQYGRLSELPRSLALTAGQLGFLLLLLVREMTIPVLFVPFGFARAWRAGGSPSHRALTIHFLMFSFGLLLLLNHGTDPRDSSIATVFYLPAVLLGLLVGAPVLLDIARWAEGKARRLSFALPVLSVLPLVLNFSVCDARAFTLAGQVGRAMLDAAEKDAVILTEGDNDTFILSYLQVVEGKRDDVEIWDRDLNLFTERFTRGPGGRATAEALNAAVDSLVSSGTRPVYAVNRFTRGSVGGRSLAPIGPLYRFAGPEERLVPTEFDRYHPGGFRAALARNDYMASRFAVAYLMRWVDHYRETGNRSGLAGLNAYLRDAGGDLRETYFVLGEGAVAAGDTAGAIGRFEEAVAADPQYHEARRELADLLRAVGRLDRAEGEYRALTERTGDPRDFLNLGNILLLSGKEEESARAYRAAQSGAPGDTLLLSGVVHGFGTLGLAADQAGALEALRDVAPEDFRGDEALGDAYDLLGRAEDALAAYTEAKRLDPESGRVAYKLGVLLLHVGRTAEAETELRRAIEADPGFASALNALAYLYAQSGSRLDEALHLADRALEVGAPDQAGYFHDTRGAVLARLGRNGEAEASFRRALQATPAGDTAARAETSAHLAEILDARGEREEARKLRAQADSLRAPGP